jgi:hypothetical protein
MASQDISINYLYTSIFPITVDRKSRDFNLQNKLVPRKGRYVVLMFVNFTRGNLEIEYEIIDKARPESARNASLTEKGKLQLNNSLRKFKRVMFNQCL